MEKSKKVIFTGSIPQCPVCKKPTKREKGSSAKTMMYFQPQYNEKGENTNPDRNTITTDYKCHCCDNSFMICGNGVDGYNYK